MDKEFYEFLYNLRASGFSHNTKENTRQLIYQAHRQNGDGFRLFIHNNGEIASARSDGEVGSLSDQAIINYRNAIITVAATMHMIAGDHYVDQETSVGLCDYYINKAEIIRTAADFEHLANDLFESYHQLFERKPWQSYGRVLDQCVDFIYQRLYSHLTLQEVADYVGYSPSYLSSLFKKKTGRTLYAFIQESKILEAQKMLLCTNQSLTSIASALGYHSLSHFSKAFKAIVGIPPLQYRITDPVRQIKEPLEMS